MPRTKKTKPRLLVEQVDALGRLRDKLNKLKTAEHDLAEAVRAGMAAIGLDLVEGRAFVAHLSERRTLTIDPRRFYRTVPLATFLRCVRVDLASARRACPGDGLDAVGDMKTTPALRVSRRAGGGKGTRA